MIHGYKMDEMQSSIVETDTPGSSAVFKRVVLFASVLSLMVMTMGGGISSRGMIAEDSYYYKAKTKPSSVLLPLLRNVYDDISIHGSYTPIYWPIPPLGVTGFMPILKNCYNLNLTKRNESIEEPSLDIVSGFVNVDLESDYGISKAYELGLMESNVANIITTTKIYEAQNLFDDKHLPKIFLMIRHPFQRLYDIFYINKYRLQTNDYENYTNFLDYLEQDENIPHNHMVSHLSLTVNANLKRDNLISAVEVLNRTIVGLFEHPLSSVKRFEHYFKWVTLTSTSSEKCVERMVTKKIESIPKLSPLGPEWKILEKTNKFDYQFYKYASKIYKLQGRTIFKRVRGTK